LSAVLQNVKTQRILRVDRQRKIEKPILIRIPKGDFDERGTSESSGQSKQSIVGEGRFHRDCRVHARIGREVGEVAWDKAADVGIGPGLRRRDYGGSNGASRG
jgi:hypothetical protein